MLNKLRSMPHISAAIVLCGGASQRMGQPKALLPWQGRTLLQHVVQQMQSITQRIVVVAAPEQELPALVSTAALRIVHDPVAHAGPLAGMITGFNALAGISGWVAVRAVDMPLLQPNWYESLLALHTEESQAIIPQQGDFLEPLAGLYHTDCCSLLQRAWDQGERSLQRAVQSCRMTVVEASSLRQFDPELISLRNMNTWEEYTASSRSPGSI
jgi:molybdenum cofactor guanylyltransferase